AGPAHSLALGLDGTVWIWGANAYGYAGRPGPDFCSTEGGEPITCNPTPSRVGGLPGVTAIAAGGAHNLALASRDDMPPPGQLCRWFIGPFLWTSVVDWFGPGRPTDVLSVVALAHDHPRPSPGGGPGTPGHNR
ncbi:MAG: hypothetical protein M3R02_31640, partial [Chloroflexota bacterium]|nr:hypothetical protein [Chloroflexota bacterium]